MADAQIIEVFKNFSARVAEGIAGKRLPPGLPVELWFQHDMRVGQKNGLA